MTDIYTSEMWEKNVLSKSLNVCFMTELKFIDLIQSQKHILCGPAYYL